ncbi:HET-domain-containing protein [Lophiotrema nucula]|uniref:HET-domain-containing protein n=1 Tax=Lophiotrema nucula TaxID=690887 RepID=A0A6A5YPM5_9PLEO|nr:HET-domain-containing protein [Lophiotrema nucula]
MSTRTLSPYAYIPLSPSQIRLLGLQPSADVATPLRCHLEEVSLETELSYEALSWTWGDPAPTDDLIVDDLYNIKISANLRDALLQLRLHTRPRRMWVDAVCINQPDEVEKAGQIPQRANIYRGAYSVLVWLGNHEAEAIQLAQLNKFAAKEPGVVPRSNIKAALAAVTALPWFKRR